MNCKSQLMNSPNPIFSVNSTISPALQHTSFGGVFLQRLFKTNAVDKRCSSANTCSYSSGKSAVLPNSTMSNDYSNDSSADVSPTCMIPPAAELEDGDPFPFSCATKSGTAQKK